MIRSCYTALSKSFVLLVIVSVLVSCNNTRINDQSIYKVIIKTDANYVNVIFDGKEILPVQGSGGGIIEYHVYGDEGRFNIKAGPHKEFRITMYQTYAGSDAKARYAGDGRIGGFGLGPYREISGELTSEIQYGSSIGFINKNTSNKN